MEFKADGPGVVRGDNKVVAYRGKILGQQRWIVMYGIANHKLVATALDRVRGDSSSEDLARELNKLEQEG